MRTLWKFICFAYKSYRQYFHVIILSSIIKLGTTLFSAITLSLFLGSVERGEGESLRILLLVLVVTAVLSYLNKRMEMKERIHLEGMNETIKLKISEKIMSLPFSYLEDSTTMELKKNAEMGVNNMGAIWDLCNSFFTILTNICTLLGLGLIIFSFDPMLILLLIIGIIINIVLICCQMKTQIQFFQDLLPINYKYGYYLNTILDEKNGKDFRLYSNYELLYDQFVFFAKEVESYFKKLNIKQSFYNSLISTVRYVQMGLLYSLVGIKALTQEFTLSQFSLVVSSAITFSECITKIIEASGRFIRAVEYVSPLIELLEIESDKDEGTIIVDEIESITFDHVSFAYPHTNKKVLDDVSFTIHKNEKISLVGVNGAGKTTIVKLICRLYDPDEGQILINGIPLVQLNRQSTMKQISTVFQDYKLFAMSVKENISLNHSLDEIKKISKEVGISDIIEGLPYQWDSVLVKAYNERGVALSGGQLQKIAITRALAKPADLLILDEPTSALDPLAEAEVYRNFNELSKSRTSLYISHRMSSSVFCDKILVLENGKIVDFDSHENLMKKTDSLYYQLFHTQARNYTL